MIRYLSPTYITASVHYLFPYIYNTSHLPLIRFYALTLRWLLPSLPLPCLRSLIFFTLYSLSGTLTLNLGCFPLDNSPSHALSQYTPLIRSSQPLLTPLPIPLTYSLLT